MSTPTRLALAAITLIAPAFAPAFAQDTIGTLQVEGRVMTSTGGEFAPATSGAPVVAGEQIMVAEGSRATVQLGNGNVLTYDAPGVYTVQLPGIAPPAPAGTAVASAAPVGLGATGVIIGAAIVGGALIASDGDDEPDAPVSR